MKARLDAVESKGSAGEDEKPSAGDGEGSKPGPTEEPPWASREKADPKDFDNREKQAREDYEYRMKQGYRHAAKTYVRQMGEIFVERVIEFERGEQSGGKQKTEMP